MDGPFCEAPGDRWIKEAHENATNGRFTYELVIEDTRVTQVLIRVQVLVDSLPTVKSSYDVCDELFERDIRSSIKVIRPLASYEAVKSIVPATRVSSGLLPRANELWGKLICLQVCVSPQGGAWSGGAWSRGVPGPRGCLVPGGGLVPGDAWWRPPRWLLMRAVRILLECILFSIAV